MERSEVRLQGGREKRLTDAPRPFMAAERAYTPHAAGLEAETQPGRVSRKLLAQNTLLSGSSSTVHVVEYRAGEAYRYLLELRARRGKIHCGCQLSRSATIQWTRCSALPSRRRAACTPVAEMSSTVRSR